MNLKFDLDTTLGDVRSALDRADITSAIGILEKLKQTEQSQVFEYMIDWLRHGSKQGIST